jgi:tetratricopeptide (TPR) repeat protein
LQLQGCLNKKRGLYPYSNLGLTFSKKKLTKFKYARIFFCVYRIRLEKKLFLHRNFKSKIIPLKRVQKNYMFNMKKLWFSALALVALSFTVSAQDEDAEKSLKTATKAYSSYNLDPANNKSKLEEAKKAIDIACEKAPTNATCKAWTTKGQIYSEFANADDIEIQLQKIKKPNHPEAPLTAFKAFKKGHELAVKKWEKSDAIKGILDMLNKLRNAGADRYSEKNYAGAYETFNAVVDANTILKAAGEKAILAEGDVNTYAYYAALSAQGAGMNAEAEAGYKKLIADKFELKDNPGSIYSGLYNVLVAQKKEEESVKALEDGVKMYPNDTELLFSQINYYLKQNKLSELIDKLKSAISKEPSNAGLYSTLGSVYDNLSQIEAKKGDAAKSEEYTKEAMSYYDQSLAKDPKNFDAVYSIGAMYYNKAAAMTEQINKLQDDYSDAGTKKYEALKTQMNGVFAQALPYFQKAEVLNPNDRNTLTAIREINVRLGKMDIGEEFKKRIENLDTGKKNEAYYKN